jgi:hypothetical protein
MGRQGVSKRKPKKSQPFSSADIGGSSNVRSSEGPVVQSLVNNNRNSFNRDGSKSPAGSNNKDRKA